MTIAQLIQQERLPADFTDTVDRYYRPLANRVASLAGDQAVLLGINPFDQFGVELGKDMARAIEEGGMDDFDASTKALMEAALGDPAQ